MKLNIKQTIKIGLGFMTIMMLWGVYNWFIPIFLNDFISGLVKGDKIWIGILMALDNLFAIFMIPIMSKLSDKTNSKIGKRMPFIIVGIALSALFFALIPTSKNSKNIFILIANILLVLIAMNIYRSPCVSLMPDVTLKSNRSKGNSIINIMGGVGTVIAYGCNMVLAGRNEDLPFYIVSSLMVITLLIMIFTINEPKMLDIYYKEIKDNGLDLNDDKKEDETTNDRNSTNKRNVFLSLLVVFLVYMANNATETWLSVYSESVFKDAQIIGNLNPGTLLLIPFGFFTFIFAVPSALIADKIGRKKTILIGTILMAGGYLGAFIIGLLVGFSYFTLLFFCLCGAGFSFITINAYPLIVENCSNKEIGVYTGKYYTSSMLAQSITPALSGLFMSNLIFNNMQPLFAYCFIFIAFSSVALLLIKE